MKIYKKLLQLNKTKSDMKIYKIYIWKLLYVNKRKSDMKIYKRKIRLVPWLEPKILACHYITLSHQHCWQKLA